ncbi:MAG TPA: hypothetical protein PLY35_09405 [Thermotogota bacterium]|nr:hypothetical protein [Thermotogota bacterium]
MQKLRLLLEDIINGGKGDKSSIKDFDSNQLVIGILVELEHSDNPNAAMEIAMDHLTEDSEYYDTLINSNLVDEPLAMLIYNILYNNMELTNEISTSAAAGAYQTPNAFASSDAQHKKITSKNLKSLPGFELIPESLEKSTIHLNIRDVKNKLNEIEKIVNHTKKFKQENNTSFDQYWKSTKNKLIKINEQLVRISNKIKGILE